MRLKGFWWKNSLDEVWSNDMSDGKEIRIALAGNPNCGKTSLFNALTGAHQKVGNFSGVTVEKHEGYLDYKGYRIVVVDLPGIYSLTPYSPEEIVTREYLIREPPDVVVNVLEGPNLERNLVLTTQLMELEVDFLVALNMIDEVEEKGIIIEIKQLQKLLGCHIIPTSAKKSRGLDSLLDHVIRVSRKDIAIRKNKLFFRPEVESSVEKITAMLTHQPELGGYNARWLAIKLLENDREVYHEVQRYPVWVKVELLFRMPSGKLNGCMIRSRRCSLPKIVMPLFAEPCRSVSGSRSAQRPPPAIILTWWCSTGYLGCRSFYWWSGRSFS